MTPFITGNPYSKRTWRRPPWVRPSHPGSRERRSGIPGSGRSRSSRRSRPSVQGGRL